MMNGESQKNEDLTTKLCVKGTINFINYSYPCMDSNKALLLYHKVVLVKHHAILIALRNTETCFRYFYISY